MSNARQLLKEEFVPAALFIKTSFKRDREELVVKFFDYTPDYLVGFEKQIEKVKTVQQVLVLTEEQKKATSNLYLKAKMVNNEFNFLVSYFKKCDLDIKPLSQVKRDLTALNIEGAVDKINGVIQRMGSPPSPSTTSITCRARTSSAPCKRCWRPTESTWSASRASCAS